MRFGIGKKKKKAVIELDKKKESMIVYDNKNSTLPEEYKPPYRVRKFHKGKYVYCKEKFLRMPSNWVFFGDFVEKYGDGKYDILNTKSRLVKSIYAKIPKVKLSKIKIMEKRIAELEIELEGKEQRDYDYQLKLKIAAGFAYQGKDSECARVIEELFPKK